MQVDQSMLPSIMQMVMRHKEDLEAASEYADKNLNSRDKISGELQRLAAFGLDQVPMQVKMAMMLKLFQSCQDQLS